MTKLTPREVIAEDICRRFPDIDYELVAEEAYQLVLALRRAGYVIEEDWKPIAEADGFGMLGNSDAIWLGHAVNDGDAATAFRPFPAPPKEPRP